jgi:methylenetetrahydrofolate reductase (NADPH)
VIETKEILKTDSGLEKLLNNGVFAVTAELGPPNSADPSRIDKKIDYLKGAIDAANITDNQSAVAKISSIGTGFYVAQRGLEPIIQMTCRDRNRLAIQADLLGAYVNGIKNVLCLTGDHQSLGNHPKAKQVFDIDSIQLIKIVKDMRDLGVFECGEEIKAAKKAEIMPPKLYIGAASNPFAEPLEWRVLRLEKKAIAGVDFIQTQCIYDMDRFEEFMNEVVQRNLHKKVKILAGLTPLRSAGMATYMKQNVSGVTVPDAMIKRISESKDAKSEGIEICVEQIQKLKSMEGVAGIHVMAIEWESAVRGIVEAAGLLPRPRAE